MPHMRNAEGQLHFMPDDLVEEARSTGWEVYDVAARKPVAKPAEVDTIAEQSAPRRTGRPRRAAQALTDEVSDGISPDDN